MVSVEPVNLPIILATKELSIDAHNTSSIKSLVSSCSDPSPLPEVLQRSDPRPNSSSGTIHWRPDIGKLVTRDIEEADRKLKQNGRPNGRVLVVVCGPRRLAGDVRASVASWVARGEGVGVELLVEEFGW